MKKKSPSANSISLHTISLLLCELHDPSMNGNRKTEGGGE